MCNIYIKYITPFNCDKWFEFSVECYPGFCVDKNNKSIIQSVSITGIINRKTIIESLTGEHTKEECMEACDKKRSESGFMTACEWKGKKECHFYTKPVHNGNGDIHYQCCVFNQGKLNYIYWFSITSCSIWTK